MLPRSTTFKAFLNLLVFVVLGVFLSLLIATVAPHIISSPSTVIGFGLVAITGAVCFFGGILSLNRDRDSGAMEPRAE